MSDIEKMSDMRSFVAKVFVALASRESLALTLSYFLAIFLFPE